MVEERLVYFNWLKSVQNSLTDQILTRTDLVLIKTDPVLISIDLILAKTTWTVVRII